MPVTSSKKVTDYQRTCELSLFTRETMNVKSACAIVSHPGRKPTSQSVKSKGSTKINLYFLN